MKTIKVRVTKAEPSYWYADKVGQVLEVIEIDNFHYQAINRCRIIIKTDCEIVEPTLNDRFEPLTSGGYPFHIYEEFDGRLFGRVKKDGSWGTRNWFIDGCYYPDKCNSENDLIPRKSPETIALEKRKAELQAELTEIENKLKEK
jgi:hypothetical protein